MVNWVLLRSWPVAWTSFAVPGVQKEAGEQKGGPADPLQGAGHMPAGKGPVQTHGQPAPRTPPVPEEEIPRADRTYDVTMAFLFPG